MPNFIEIGGVTRKPLVDLTRNDPMGMGPNARKVTKLSDGAVKITSKYQDCRLIEHINTDYISTIQIREVVEQNFK